MREPDDRDVYAVNIHRRLAVLDDGTHLRITDMFDAYGDTCGPDEASSCVATDGETWWAIDLSWFDPIASN